MLSQPQGTSLFLGSVRGGEASRPAQRVSQPLLRGCLQVFISPPHMPCACPGVPREVLCLVLSG